MAEHWGPLEARLRALGDQPVPLEVQARHLAAMAAVATAPAPAAAPTWRRRAAISHPLRAAAAAAMVAILGSTGLASAGALPDPAQRIAHSVLSAVGIDVPSTDAADGPATELEEPADAPRTTGGGQEPGPSPEPTDAPTAGAGTEVPVGAGAPTTTPPATTPDREVPPSDPGQGAGGGGPVDQPTGPPVSTPGGEHGPGGDCNGPPPWVTNPDMSKAEKDAAQADRRSRCAGAADG